MKEISFYVCCKENKGLHVTAITISLDIYDDSSLDKLTEVASNIAYTGKITLC